MPLRAAPTIQPLIPPVALPMMDAQPISKKQVKVSGMITVGNIPAVRMIVIVDVIMATMKPIISALGAQLKITGQSSCRDSSRNHLFCNSLESGNDFRNQHTDAEKHDGNAHAEVNRLCENKGEYTGLSACIAPDFTGNQAVCLQNKEHCNVCNTD